MSQPAVGLLLAAEAYKRLPHDIDTRGGLQAAILANPYLAAILPGGASPHRMPSRITKDGVVATMTDTEIRVTDTTTRTTRTLPGDFRQAPGIELWPDDHTAAIAVGDTLRLIDIADGHDTTPPLALPPGKLNVLLSPRSRNTILPCCPTGDSSSTQSPGSPSCPPTCTSTRSPESSLQRGCAVRPSPPTSP